MRLLLDQDVYESTGRFLGGLGHDVVTAYQAGLAAAEDGELVSAATKDRRILVTRDRHFGALVFHQKASVGVIYLRTSPSTLEETHRQLAEVLVSYSEDSLRQAFVTVEPGRHRFRRVSR
jgi:predicted nuclease of predicted toxin-antitoxin system